jgi:hypothetical protein
LDAFEPDTLYLLNSSFVSLMFYAGILTFRMFPAVTGWKRKNITVDEMLELTLDDRQEHVPL